MEIQGKVAIVTGASMGIGEATARLLARKGAKVVLTSRSFDKLEALAKALPGALVVPADMAKEAEVRMMVAKALAHMGRVDILVNNAGRGYDAPVEHIRTDLLRDLFELDLIGPLVAMQQVIPQMRAQGGGFISNISSGLALMHLPGMSAYAAMKRALVGISLTAREELKADKIGVNVVYPYMTLTEFEKNTLKHEAREWKSNAGDEGGFKPPDSAEDVARKIVEGIESEAAEVFVHEWMQHRQEQG